MCFHMAMQGVKQKKTLQQDTTYKQARPPELRTELLNYNREATEKNDKSPVFPVFIHHTFWRTVRLSGSNNSKYTFNNV